MANCPVTGKGPQSGNNVSHANNKTKRRFLVNLKKHRFLHNNKFVTLRLSTAGIRLVDKLGIEAVLRLMKANKVKV